MNKYIAFLRGINISGKNKIAMSDLKKEFEEMKFSEVATYLNSGNVLFLSDNDNDVEIKEQIESMLDKKFGLKIPIYIIRLDCLKDILTHAPQWWENEDKDQYHNLIFVISSDTADDICKMVGEPTKDLEEIHVYKNVIFWTFDRKAYFKCSWWKKTASAGIAEKLTIRTANTVRKMCK